MKAFRYLRLLLALLRLGKNPDNTAQVFVIADELYALQLQGPMIEQISKDEASRKLIKERKRLSRFDLQELQKLPVGTLGNGYAEHMLSRGLNPDFFPVRETVNDINAVIMRLRETHDLWHVLTGFDTTPVSEIGLQAFTYAQVRSPLASILVAAGLLRASLTRPQAVAQLWKSIVDGYEMGIQAKPVFALDWEANWTTPLSDLRKLYEIESLSANFSVSDRSTQISGASHH